jgi:hypothetical protein
MHHSIHVGYSVTVRDFLSRPVSSCFLLGHSHSLAAKSLSQIAAPPTFSLRLEVRCEYTDAPQIGLLCLHCRRPRYRRTADALYELTLFHSTPRRVGSDGKSNHRRQDVARMLRCSSPRRKCPSECRLRVKMRNPHPEQMFFRFALDNRHAVTAPP